MDKYEISMLVLTIILVKLTIILVIIALKQYFDTKQK